MGLEESINRFVRGSAVTLGEHRRDARTGMEQAAEGSSTQFGSS